MSVEIDPARAWQRVKKDNHVYWLKHFEIKCFGCGTMERGTAVVDEGPYDPGAVFEIEDEMTGQVKKIYPTFSPQGGVITEWDIPQGWTQVTHLTTDFYPNEIITAIHLNLSQTWSLLKKKASKYNWTGFVEEGGYEIELDRDLSFMSFIKHPIVYIRNLIDPKIKQVTFDSDKLANELDALWLQVWVETEGQVLTPYEIFHKWYEHTNNQYAEWVCPCEECHMSVAKKNYRYLTKLGQLPEMNGQPLRT